MESESELDLREYLQVLKRRWWLILAAVALCAGAAVAVTLLQPKLYTSTAKVVISAQQDIASTGQGVLSAPNQLQNQVETQVQVVKSPQVKAAVDARLGDEAVKVESVSASGVSNTRVMSISVTSESPEIARTAADIYVDSYLNVSQQNKIERMLSIGETVNQKKRDLQVQIDELTPAARGAGPEADASKQQIAAYQEQITQLQKQYNDAQAAALVRESAAEPLQAAQLPTSPSSPKPVRNLALALLLGLLLGAGLVLLMEHFDNRVRNKERFLRRFPDVTFLGSVPRGKGWRSRKAVAATLVEPHSPMAEAYRALRTNLDFVRVHHDLKVLSITSAVAGEGKSTTVANLAEVLCWAGQHVVVVSADLRRPKVHEFFNVENSQGFSDVLISKKKLSDVLQKVEVPGGTGTIELLNTGALPPNPAEVLASVRTQELFEELRKRADIVLVDGPPVLPVADPLIIAQLSDAVMMVASEATSVTELGDAIEVMAKSSETPLIGVLLNGSDEERLYSYRYEGYAAAK